MYQTTLFTKEQVSQPKLNHARKMNKLKKKEIIEQSKKIVRVIVLDQEGQHRERVLVTMQAP